MKKTVQVNLSGQVFTLDEDAYELLSGYLNKIGRLYERSVGKDDILSDIESRIAELLLEKIDDSKSVVNIRDVEEVIQVMGKPEQFEEDYDAESDEGAYQQEDYSYRTKRLYRDPDSRVLGGVCSGIGYYFGFDPIWIRLIFGLSFVFFGTGLFLYILLWIIIPEARTTAEKLSMKGEPVNINNIGKTIEKEFDAFGERISNKEGAFRRNQGKKLERGVDRLFHFLAEIFRGLFTVIGKLFGTLFIVVGVFVFISLLAGVFGSADVIHLGSDSWSAGMDIYEWRDVVFNSDEWFFMAIVAFFLFVGIPFLALAYGGFVLLMPRYKVPYLGASLISMWFIGVVLAILTGLGIAQEFSKNESISDVIMLEDLGLKADTITLSIGDDPFNVSMKRAYYANNDFMMKSKDDYIIVGNVDFDIRKSQDDEVTLEVVRHANGASFEAAADKAEAIDYQFRVDSSNVILDPFFKYPQEDLLRSQEVSLVLRIPEGKAVFLDEGIKRIIDDIDNLQDMYDPRMVEHLWEMTPKGLDCVDCDKERRYIDSANVSISVEVN